MHPHTERFGVRVRGVRDAAPAGPQDEHSRRFGDLVGGKYPPIGGGAPAARKAIEQLHAPGSGTPPQFAQTVIDDLVAQRNTRKHSVDSILAKCTLEGRDLRASEQREFDRDMAEVTAIDAMIDAGGEPERRRNAAGAAARTIGANGSGARRSSYCESDVYTRDKSDSGETSYFRDVMLAERGDYDARSRLQAYAGEREARTNPNRTDGTGGYFVPPVWLVDEYIQLARAGRVFADLVTNLPMPDGTDQINIPKVATGTTTAIQTADAAGVSSTDLTDSVSTAAVRTIAGQQDFALQLLEQSPRPGFDAIIGADLSADYAMQLDRQLFTGTNANGQVQGINGLAGTNSVTYTDGTPTAIEAWPTFAQALSLIADNRFMPATAFVMHPRRWYWLASALDTQSRPLVVPAGAPYGPANVMATQGVAVAEGPAGALLGVPVYTDANVPTNQGGGTEDRIYAVRAPDLLLWEGELRVRTLMEVLSGTLQVRLQVYNYIAWMPDRYPKSISVISGTGLIAPSGF